MTGAVRHEGLIRFCSRALSEAGLSERYAAIVAEVLVDADLLGHSTHGVALLPRYLEELRAGRMTSAGTPEILRDSGRSTA